MHVHTLFFDYIHWHYVKAFSSIWNIVGNFIWFFYNFFSLPLLIHTLFAPWHKLHEERKGLVLGKIFEGLLVNSMMRIFGLVVRLVTISIGIFCILGSFLAGVMFTLFWVVAPLVGILCLLVGIRVII